MKVKVKFLKEYQDLFVPGEEKNFGPEEAEYLVENGYAKIVKPKAKPKAKEK